MLYPIVDVESLDRSGVPPVEFARAVLAVKPRWLQLRAKSSSPRDMLSLLSDLAPMCRAAGAQLILDDRPDVARAAGCWGVHVGQDDLDVEEVRRCFPSLAVGVSTHDVAQLRAAIDSRPTYVALGPIFATKSKHGADPVVGLEHLETCHELTRAAKVPLVAIGGITVENVARVAPHCDYVAVIGDLQRRSAVECRQAAIALAEAIAQITPFAGARPGSRP